MNVYRVRQCAAACAVIIVTAFGLSATAHAATPPKPVIYMVGDSITAGARTTLPARDGYARRTLDKFCGYGCNSSNSVIIGRNGQCLIAPNCGARLVDTWPSVLRANPKPTTVVLEIGRNDMSRNVSDATLKTAYLDVIRQARNSGVRVILGTIPPAAPGFPSYLATEQQRIRINTWIRTFALVADFEKALVEPGKLYLWSRHDSGDHLHPSDLGALRMADAVNRAWLL